MNNGREIYRRLYHRRKYSFLPLFVGSSERGNDVNFDADETARVVTYRLILTIRTLHED